MDVIRARGGFVMKIHGGPTMMAGVPDITGVYRGKSLWFETKLPGNKPTPIQLRRLYQIQQAGGIAYVVRSKQDVIQILNKVDSHEIV
jgi:penicillin-binding protein-related factor A (putative recombinase)